MPTPLRPARFAMVTLAKEEAAARIARHLAGLKRQMEALRAQLRSPDRADGYLLNFQVNALKKEIHRWRAQAIRIRKQSQAETVIPEALR